MLALDRLGRTPDLAATDARAAPRTASVAAARRCDDDARPAGARTRAGDRTRARREPRTRARRLGGLRRVRTAARPRTLLVLRPAAMSLVGSRRTGRRACSGGRAGGGAP